MPRIDCGKEKKNDNKNSKGPGFEAEEGWKQKLVDN